MPVLALDLGPQLQVGVIIGWTEKSSSEHGKPVELVHLLDLPPLPAPPHLVGGALVSAPASSR